MSCHRHVWRTSPSAVLSDVFRWGKRYRVHKLMLLIQTYEKPCIKRTRIAEENTYYPRWFYLKYATEVIKYSFRNHLRLGTPLDPRDEQRLPSFAGLRAPTAAERGALLASVEAQLAALYREILRMDDVNVITNAPKARPATGAAAAAAGGSAAAAGPAQQLHVTAADILRDTEVRKQGVLPPLAVFLQQHQQRLSSSTSNTEQQQEEEQQQQQWSKDELRVLYFRLKKYVSLCKQRQQLRETLTLQHGQAGTATWTRSLSDEQMLAELFSTMPSSSNSSSKQHRQNSSNITGSSLNKK